MHLFPFPWLLNYNHASQCNKSSTHLLSIRFWLKIFFPFLQIMVSHMAMSYGLQVAQMNEGSALESFLDLTLT
jgi:lipopolysaccharide export LptBFGC system permease protein LptF